MDRLLQQIARKAEHFLEKHSVGATSEFYGVAPLTGEFALHRGQLAADLYGMIDATYILFTIGKLRERTNRKSRQIWAERILVCQDEQGRFSKLNLRGHPVEHATAYAIGALKLLSIEAGEYYIDRIRPLEALLPLLTERASFLRWIGRLGFRLTPRGIAGKNLGWHYIWRGSHVGGGIAAAIGMTSDLFDTWWPGAVNSEEWFGWYFEWLDAQANPSTGYWQRAFWNRFYHKPTTIDLGGAVHFLWTYEALGHPLPYPEQAVLSTLRLQRKHGLYKDHPFCIDLDGNFCVIRSFLQLPDSKQELYCERVHRSVEANFEGVAKWLTERRLEETYPDSHGLPGALAALSECAKLPGFKYAESTKEWQHPLDRVWWL